jgi:hypothetical protein
MRLKTARNARRVKAVGVVANVAAATAASLSNLIKDSRAGVPTTRTLLVLTRAARSTANNALAVRTRINSAADRETRPSDRSALGHESARSSG